MKQLPRRRPARPPEPEIHYEGPVEELPIRISAQVALGGAWDEATTAATRAYWDTRADNWTENMGPDHTVPLEDGLERLDRPPTRILELGAGTGLGTKVIRRIHPEAKVVATDISALMLHQARKEGAEALMVAADGQALPFKAASFDLVVLLNAFLFPSEVRRVTEPGGTVLGAWSIGRATPIYITAEQAEAALDAEAVGAPAGWGEWWRVSPRRA